MFATKRLIASMLAALMAPCALAAVTITGEVRALGAQLIYTPVSNNSPVVLRHYVADGTEVKKGDALLRIDPGQAAARMRTLHADIERAEARAQKEVAELEVKAIDAELAFVDAQAAAEKARLDAGLPRELLSGLDYDRYQGELQRCERDLRLKEKELETARDTVQRRRKDGELEAERMRLEQDFQRLQLESAAVSAQQDGVVLHYFDPRTTQRFDEGSSAQVGQVVGEVASLGKLGVRAYALETERHQFARGNEVSIEFDAFPKVRKTGRIESISGAPDTRPVWGTGRYFTIDIVFDESVKDVRLLPGMSVRVRSFDAKVTQQ